MTFIIRLFLQTFMLLSCSGLSYSYANIIAEQFQPKSTISKDFIEDIDYSFINLEIGSNQYILVLSNVNNGFETWVGQNYEKVITYKGLIVEVYGFNNNNFIINKSSFYSLLLNFPFSDFDAKFNFDNPILINSNLIYKYESSMKTKDCPNLLVFKKEFPDMNLKIRFKNTICYDINNRPLTSIQKVFPQARPFAVYFYYKY